jgi:hypothetical protein
MASIPALAANTVLSLACLIFSFRQLFHAEFYLFLIRFVVNISQLSTSGAGFLPCCRLLLVHPPPPGPLTNGD